MVQYVLYVLHKTEQNLDCGLRWNSDSKCLQCTTFKRLLIPLQHEVWMTFDCRKRDSMDFLFEGRP